MLGFLQELNEKTFKGRVILLDLAFQKKQYESQLPKSDEKVEGEEAENGDDNENGENVEEGEKNIENDNENDNEDVNEDDNEENEEKEEKEDENLEEKQENPSNESKKPKEVKIENLDNTVFLSNLPYDLTEKELRDFANNFGAFDYAKVFYLILLLKKN